MSHKFEIGDHVAIVGGGFYGENGKILEKLISGLEPVYGVKILTGKYRDMRGSTVIKEIHLRPE